jgi:tetratricopeptide (TPR) repeat protein
VGQPREAALLLGELYLQRGFYRLAGDAALQAIDYGGPCARALALLGKAGVAEGMIDDALPILEQALELDPSLEAVRFLLEQIRSHAAAA